MAQQHTDDDAVEPDADEYEPPLFELETAGTETEDDIQDAKDIHFRDVVLAPSDWTVETVLSQLRSKSFELDPDFQRRNAWTDARKSKFIESLMLGLPIPQLVFAEHDDDEDDSARYIVIDGKQRLLTLESFHSDQQPLRLQGLAVLPMLNGKTRTEIAEDPVISRYVKRLANRTIRTVVIRRWPDDSFLHLVFHRINHQTLALSAQELRQALNPGPFTRFADRFSGKSMPLHRILGTTQIPDFRMRDVELLVRFLAYQLRLDSYGGNLKRFLDLTCKELNQQWSTMEDQIVSAANACNSAIEATERIFERNSFRRYSDQGTWENRFNRAVFDVMLYYFANNDTASLAEERKGLVVEAYQNLSISDGRFAQSLAATTKTLSATSYRLSAWGRTLAQVIDRPLQVPIVAEGAKQITYQDA